jgi:hypothetical protein
MVAPGKSLCAASKQCSHWTNFGTWLSGTPKGYIKAEGMCLYAKIGVWHCCCFLLALLALILQ